MIKHDGSKDSKKLTLDEIFSKPDAFGLLNVKPKASTSPKSIEASKFEEINQFIDKYQRLPNVDAENIMEKQLAHRLEGFRKSKVSDAIKNIDRHSLLTGFPSDAPVEGKNPVIQKEVSSIDDILNSDSFGLLNTPDLGIFDLKHVPATPKEMPDEIAERKRCEDFYQFQSIFRQAHEKLDARQVEVIPFKQGSQIDRGDIFILRGMLCLVDEIGEFNNSGEPYNPRLRVIFENGTESNLLLRSLAAALYKDEHGRRLLSSAADVEDKLNNITHKDKRSGVVYIVKTLSENPVLKSIPNLYKIGYTELTVEDRTRNAERDIAFLEAPIKIIASIECFNMNPQRFESLIHAFLSSQRLVLELTGRDGKKYHPKEWFSVPLDTAREAIRRIIDGTIIQYRIDNTTGQLVQKR